MQSPRFGVPPGLLSLQILIDNPEAVAKRIEIFYENTLPLLANWAQEEKRVYTIDASKDVETVYDQIKVVLSAY